MVRILHPEPSAPGPLERRLVEARRALAERHRLGFEAAGAADVRVLAGPPDDTPFGARLRGLVGRRRVDGLVVLGSGALPLARASDRRAFVEVAAGREPVALANNRFSADAVAIACAGRLGDLPDLPGDNALPRWLEEVAGYRVADLGRRWRLGIDLDSPLDVALLGEPVAEAGLARERLAAVRSVALDRRAELLVAGRTSARTLGWLERAVPARVRALVEERGLRAGTRLALADPGRGKRPPRSIVGALLDRVGPDGFGPALAELADAAVVDTRVLLAHRLGADEAGWPPAEDRFASDLLLADRVADPWLQALTASAAAAPIPIVLGGHTLVGPGLRLALR